MTAERKKGMAGKISIPQPYLVKKFNDGLGVLTNWFVLSLYRVRYRLMKWRYPFYSFILNVSVNNSWKLYMKTSGNKVRMLNFLRGVVVQLVSVHYTWI